MLFDLLDIVQTIKLVELLSTRWSLAATNLSCFITAVNIKAPFRIGYENDDVEFDLHVHLRASTS